MEKSSQEEKDPNGVNDCNVCSQDLKEKVLKVLREKRVNLWEVPYVTPELHANEETLKRLVSDWKENGKIDASESSAIVISALKQWQSRALEKLEAKNKVRVKLEIKILGLPMGAVVTVESCPFADIIHTIDTQVNNKRTVAAPVLLLEGVRPQQVTDVVLLDFLRETLDATSIRIIYNGKNLSDTGPKRKGKVLAERLQKLESENTTIRLLCLVKAGNPNDSSTKEKKDEIETSSSIQSRIDKIRNAALKIRDSTKVEITDQHGVIVPMTADDRLSFLTALGLHRMGLKAGGSPEDALVLFLEADKEWNTHPGLQGWMDRVDNYGLLQLDMAWAYLQMQSLENLPDCISRLAVAQTVLSKQVHQNFTTLATAQAEMGNFKQVPPLAAVFAKLFLLQGIAIMYDGRKAEGKKLCDDAFFLLQSLRMLAPTDDVDQLLEISQVDGDVTRSDVIAALRRNQGNPDAAAIALSDERANLMKRDRDREIQRIHGVCKNEKDPVNLTCAEQLQTLLGPEGTTEELAVGLLRLADNDLTRALDIYKVCNNSPVAVFAKVEALDESLVAKGLMSRSTFTSRKRKFQMMKEEQQVDQISLATLLSMGLEDRMAKLALRQNGNNVDQALLWLSRRSDDTKTKEEDTVDNVSRNESLTSSIEENENEADAEDDTLESTTDGHRRELEEENQRQMEYDAEELLHRELGEMLEDRDLEKEYLGSTLDEEWELVLKYRSAE
jgi:hypothetical protein